MAEPRAMKRMCRTLRPRLRTCPTTAAGFCVSTGLWVRVGVGCIEVPSRLWEGSRYPADHFRPLRDEAHGGLVSSVPDCPQCNYASDRFLRCAGSFSRGVLGVRK